jgi:hypothetical protein
VRERRFNPVPLVIGLACIALSLSWLIGGKDSFDDIGRFAVPVGLIGVGVAVLLSRGRADV